MITTIIIVGLGFTWLGYESNWMRVRLISGALAPILEQEYKTWEELKPWNIKKTDPTWLRFPEIMAPLTGWDWLLNTKHIIPEYKVELINNGSKITMRTNSMPTLRDAFRVYRNPWVKVQLLERARGL